MELESLKRTAKKELLASVPILLLAVIAPLLGWFGFLKGHHDAGSWFQRSGSITVLFALWAEYNFFKLSENLNPRSENGLTYQNILNTDALHNEFSGYLRVSKVIAAMMAILGTIICGYGDLLYSYWN